MDTEEQSAASTSWKWLYKLPENVKQSVKEANDRLIENDVELTELDFSDVWEGKIVSALLNLTADSIETSVEDPITDKPNVIISYDEENRKLTLPSFATDFLPNSKTEFGAMEVRYAALVEEYKESDALVVLSVWRSMDENRKISNIYLQMKDATQALLFINAVNRLTYEMFEKNIDRLEKLKLLVTGKVSVIRCTAEERDQIDKEHEEDEAANSADLANAATAGLTESGLVGTIPRKNPSPTERKVGEKAETLYFVLDDEMLGFYEGEFSEMAKYDFRFYKDPTEQSIETIFVCNVTGQLELQHGDNRETMKPGMVCFIRSVPDTPPEEDKFIDLMQKLKLKMVKPKPENIFTDWLRFEEYYKIPPSFTPQTGFLGNTGEPMPGWQPPPQPQPPFGEGATGGAGRGTAGGMNSDWLNCLVTGRHVQNSSEEMQVCWLSLQAELERIMREGQVPPSDVQTSGLDAQSMDNLSNMVEKIRDQLLAPNGLGMALSLMEQTRRVFGPTLLKDTQSVSNIDLLMRVYLLP